MSDTETDTAPAAPSGARALPLIVIAQYLKDMSFENPNAPEIITETSENPPQGSVQVDVRATSKGGPNYEVVLSLRVEARREDRLAYLLEMEYAGLFRIGAIPPEAVEPVIMIEGPRLLFPIARETVANATRDGGYAPLLINPIDFAALYRDHRQRAMQEAAQSGNEAG
jgi:preprotein translocase subunit SecB